MHHQTTDWLAGLAAFVADRRATHPPRAADAPAAAAAERAIVAAGLTSWFDDWAAVTDARRRWARAAAAAGRDPDPAFVVTTSAGGIEAAAAALGGGHPIAAAEARRIVAVTELEYRLWCIRRPDEGHLRHVNHWTWVKTSVPPQRAAEFAAHPLGLGEAYWLHRVGTAGAGAADRRDCHLWKWNGRHAALLQAFVREGRVAHFVAPKRPGDGD